MLRLKKMGIRSSDTDLLRKIMLYFLRTPVLYVLCVMRIRAVCLTYQGPERNFHVCCKHMLFKLMYQLNTRHQSTSSNNGFWNCKMHIYLLALLRCRCNYIISTWQRAHATSVCLDYGNNIRTCYNNLSFGSAPTQFEQIPISASTLTVTRRSQG